MPHKQTPSVGPLKNKTPVKIRGKGPRKKAWQPPNPAVKDAKKRSREDSDNGAGGGSGSSAEDAEKQERRKRRRQKLVMKKLSGASIERLPLEILEMILLRSENVNFPKSSQRIGRIMSNSSVYVQLILTAFGPTWDVWFGVLPTAVHSYGGWQTDNARFGGDPVFQSEVLDSSWMTVELILDAQKFWFRKDLKGRKGKKQLEDRDAQRLHYAQLEHISPGASGHDPTEDDIERCFEHEWNSHMEWAKQFLVGNTDGTSLWDRLAEHTWLFLQWVDYKPPSLDIHPRTKIPEVLIKGPFDRDKVRLLCWLVRQGAKLQASHTWEMTKIGYDRVMQLEDHELSLILLGVFSFIHVFERWPKGLVYSQLLEAMTRYEAGLAANRDHSRWAFAQTLLDTSFGHWE